MDNKKALTSIDQTEAKDLIELVRDSLTDLSGFDVDHEDIFNEEISIIEKALNLMYMKVSNHE